MNLITAFALAASSFVAAPVPKDPVRDAREALQGEWKLVQYIDQGKDRTKDREFRVHIEGNSLTIVTEKEKQLATLVLDLKTEPKIIDLQWMDKGKERLNRGLYKLEKDKLTICIGHDGCERPKEFKSEKDDDIALIVLERVEK